jgi:hypothetical protein
MDGNQAEISPSQTGQPNHVRAPYVAIATSRKLIAALGWSVVGLVVSVILLSIGFSASLNRKPWVLANTTYGYDEIGISRSKITRGDVERFLNFVIPNIYGALNGEAPGLNEIRGLVNEAIINEQERSLEQNQSYMKGQGISQFGIVMGINPETLVINRDKNFVYVEAMGAIMLTQSKRTEKTEVQWRALLYIVEPTDALASNTPAGEMRGNRMGLYLQQIAEQPPGTVNEDSPKPTVNDMQERQEETSQ